MTVRQAHEDHGCYRLTFKRYIGILTLNLSLGKQAK
jgi:hypothetical protein